MSAFFIVARRSRAKIVKGGRALGDRTANATFAAIVPAATGEKSGGPLPLTITAPKPASQGKVPAARGAAQETAPRTGLKLRGHVLSAAVTSYFTRNVRGNIELFKAAQQPETVKVVF